MLLNESRWITKITVQIWCVHIKIKYHHHTLVFGSSGHLRCMWGMYILRFMYFMFLFALNNNGISTRTHTTYNGNTCPGILEWLIDIKRDLYFINNRLKENGSSRQVIFRDQIIDYPTKYENVFLRCVDYRINLNVSRTLAGNKIVDHSDEIGASPVGAATTTSSFST